LVRDPAYRCAWVATRIIGTERPQMPSEAGGHGPPAVPRHRTRSADRSLFVSRGRFGARRGSAVGAGVAWWLGSGVTVPKCRCSGFSRPRWI